VQAMSSVSTRHRHTSPYAVHVSRRKPDVVELIQRCHVERRFVADVIIFTMLLTLTSGSHLDRRVDVSYVLPLSPCYQLCT